MSTSPGSKRTAARIENDGRVGAEARDQGDLEKLEAVDSSSSSRLGSLAQEKVKTKPKRFSRKNASVPTPTGQTTTRHEDEPQLAATLGA
jgi:hypothetical protein